MSKPTLICAMQLKKDNVIGGQNLQPQALLKPFNCWNCLRLKCLQLHIISNDFSAGCILLVMISVWLF